MNSSENLKTLLSSMTSFSGVNHTYVHHLKVDTPDLNLPIKIQRNNSITKARIAKVNKISLLIMLLPIEIILFQKNI